MGDYEFEGIFFLELLTDEEKKNFLASISKVIYKKGERIIKKDEFVTHLIYISKGYVKIHCDINLKEVILNIHGPNTLTGLSNIITSEKHPFSVTALEDSVIYLINVKTVRDFIQCNGLIANKIMEHINNSNLEYIQHNILSLSQNNIHGKLANSLLFLMDKVFYNSKFEILLSRIELAQFSKISRENVIKTLYEFDAEKIIKVNGKQIEILNEDKLRKLVDCSS